jgi:hypothetical protein
MIRRADMVFVAAHQDPEPATEANVVASLWAGSSGLAAVAAVVEEYSRPSSHI